MDVLTLSIAKQYTNENINEFQKQLDESNGYLVGLEYTKEYIPKNTYSNEVGDIEVDGTLNTNDWLLRRKFECVGKKKVSIDTVTHSKARPTICCYDEKGNFLLGVYTNDNSTPQKLECITPLNTSYIYVCTSNQNNFDTVKIYDGETTYIQKGDRYKYTNIFVGSKYDKYFSDFDNIYHNMKYNLDFYKSQLVSNDYWYGLGYISAYRIECVADQSAGLKAILRLLNRYSYKPQYSVGDTINISFKYRSVGDFYIRLRSAANTVSEETLDVYGDDVLIPNSNGNIQTFNCSFTIDKITDNYGCITPQFGSKSMH